MDLFQQLCYSLPLSKRNQLPLFPFSAGGYCPIGSSYPQPCPAGTYNNYSGASTPADCSDCSVGHYCSGTSNPAPTGMCRAGYYCTGGASDPTQFAVEAGYYSDEGASEQYPCVPGTYNNEVRIDTTSSTEQPSERLCPCMK